MVPSHRLRHNLGVAPADPTRTVFVVPHTHWDREWYAPFQTFRAQLVDLWDALLALTEADPDFRFLMDGQTVVIDDYLEIRPQSRPRVDRAIRERRIEVGPWYTLPDEFLVSGETLIRNLERGLASAASHGGSLRAGYLPDSFGHPAQMPQIYRQFGFEHAIVWRGVPLAIDRLAFTWVAPDGSEILTAYLGSSYSHGVDLPTEPSALAIRIEAALKALADFHPTADILLMNGNDHVLPQRDLSAAIRGASRHLGDTRIRLAGLGEYLRTLTAGPWPRWQGELRSSARANILMGTLSVRIPDKQHYFEATQMLERIAEPLAALSGVDCAGLLEQAWTLILQNAAHDTACGSGIDAVAEEARLRSDSARQIAEAVAARALPRLAGDGQVWNPSAFARRGLAELETDDTEIPASTQSLRSPSSDEAITFRFPAGEVGRVHSVLDERHIAGERIGRVDVSRDDRIVRIAVETRSGGVVHDLASSRLEIERLANQPGVDVLEVVIRRRHVRRVLVESPLVPGCSVAMLGSAPPRDLPPACGAGEIIENALLRCRLGADGTLSVEHKASGLTYDGLNRLVDEADAGDEYNFSPAAADRHRQAAEPVEPPTLIEGGPLRASINVRFRYRLPGRLAEDRQGPVNEEVPMLVSMTVSIERDVPRVDIGMRLENLAEDHRLRVHFPLPFPATDSHADSAYHVIRRPIVAPKRDPGAPELELPTYPMRSFVDVSGDRGGLAVISRGLHEYEVRPGSPPELALTLLRAVGWLSRDDLRYRTGHAGPFLKTPGAQVLGRHTLRYSLLFHEQDWEAAGVWRAAEAALLPLLSGSGDPVVGPAPSIDLEPACIQMTACIPRPDGYVVRILNASEHPQEAMVRFTQAPAEVRQVTLGGKINAAPRLDGGVVRTHMRPWEIATLQIRTGAV